MNFTEIMNLQYDSQELHAECIPHTNTSKKKPNLVLDLQDMPNLVGPLDAPVDTTKSLVVICVGESDKKNVDNIISTKFPATHFTFMLFHYDEATWQEFSWYSSVHVVAIRVLHKMKFWYIKRFLPPSIAQSFSHIIILDGDVELRFDPIEYLRVADAFNIAMSQPTHAENSLTAYYRDLQSHAGEQVGRYTYFIECGPAVFFSVKGYECIYDLIQTDLTSGWGIDSIWVDYFQTVCGFSNHSVGIFDIFELMHETPTGKGTASSKLINGISFNDRAGKESDEFLSRFPTMKRGWFPSPGNTFYHFGYRSCLNSADPAQKTKCT